MCLKSKSIFLIAILAILASSISSYAATTFFVKSYAQLGSIKVTGRCEILDILIDVNTTTTCDIKVGLKNKVNGPASFTVILLITDGVSIEKPVSFTTLDETKDVYFKGVQASTMYSIKVKET